jgi:hypothetical protein
VGREVAMSADGATCLYAFGYAFHAFQNRRWNQSEQLGTPRK